MVLLLIASAAALAVGGTAAEGASPQVSTVAVAPSPAKPKQARGGNRVICKDGVNITGSRLPSRRKCMMKTEWERREKHDSEAVRVLQNSGALSKVF